MIYSFFSRKRRHEHAPKNGRNDVPSPTGDTDSDSSTSPSSKASRKKSRPSTSVDHDPLTLSQREAALALSQHYLSSARSAADLSRLRLNETREECRQLQLECRLAEKWSETVQRRWGVISIDHYDSHEDGTPDWQSDEQGLVTGSDSDADDNVHLGDSEEADSAKLAVPLSPAAHLDSTTNETKPMKQIEISDAGDQIVNGIYQQCLLHHGNCSRDSRSSVNNDQTRHSQKATPDFMYIHTSGPFLLPQNQVSRMYFDLCLHKKWGYGDKMRWCIGLVPCAFKDRVRQEHEGVVTWETPRYWDLDRSHIYYWMEVSLLTFCNAKSTQITTEDHPANVLIRGKQDWCACHGTRPVPYLKEVNQHGRRRMWRSFWEALFIGEESR